MHQVYIALASKPTVDCAGSHGQPLKWACREDSFSQVACYKPSAFTTSQWIFLHQAMYACRDLAQAETDVLLKRYLQRICDVSRLMNEIQHVYVAQLNLVGLNSRQIAENLCWVLHCKSGTVDPANGTKNLNERIKDLAATGMDQAVINALHIIRVQGNEIVHPDLVIDEPQELNPDAKAPVADAVFRLALTTLKESQVFAIQQWPEYKALFKGI